MLVSSLMPLFAQKKPVSGLLRTELLASRPHASPHSFVDVGCDPSLLVSMISVAG